MKPVRAYIAGPLTKGDQFTNVNKAIRVATKLLDAGLSPFVPHLFTLWEIVEPRPYEEWLALDMCYLEVCDILVRLEGESPGADREVQRARELRIPVWNENNVDDLIALYKSGFFNG